MARKKEKEAFIVLLDVGNNTALCDESGKTFLDKSKDCLSKIIQRKLFNSSADEFGIILIGSNTTNNELALDYEDRYRNIEVVHKLALASWGLLKYVHGLTSSPNVADWLDAIIVAIKYIIDETEAKDFVQKKIVMLSNFHQEVCDESFDIIVRKMQNMNIGIVVIGPDVLNDTDAKNVNTQLSQVVGVRLISQLVTELDGTICTFEDAFPEVMYFQRKAVRPTPWNTELTISGKIKIPISGYKKTAELIPLKWLNESIDNKNANVILERKYIRYDTNRGVPVEVDEENIIDGYPFADAIVPYARVEKEAMNYKSGKKGLYLIHCTPKNNVPQYMLLGSGNYVITSRKNDEDAAVALEAFILALSKGNKVGIARRVYCDNAAVVLGALFPIVTEENRYLIFAELPFKEDEHVYRFPSLNKVEPRTKQQSEAVDDLIERMNLDETDDTPEKYDLTKTYDPQQQFIYRCVTYKALHPDEQLPDNLSDSVRHMLKPLPEIIQNSEDSLKRIVQLFPTPEKYDLTKTYDPQQQFIYRCVTYKALHPDEQLPDNLSDSVRHMLKPLPEIIQNSEDSLKRIVQLFPLKIVEKKKIKTDSNNGQQEVVENDDGYETELIEKVGTENPSQDFTVLLKQGTNHTDACLSMQDTIVSLLSLLPDEIEKPLAALKVLRNSCISENPKVYNNWMFPFKDFILREKIVPLWDEIIKSNLGLITQDESDKSDVGLSSSEEFLKASSFANDSGIIDDNLDDIFSNN